MKNKEFAKKLEDRTRQFAIAVIRLSTNLPGSTESQVIRRQLTKSGTSVGANYREANRARSRADFLNRIKICESEASETQYWLSIISDMTWRLPDNFQAIFDEGNELLAIFTAIGKRK